MFTLIRPVAAILLAIFAFYAAKAYEPLYDPQAVMGNFALWTAGVGGVTGWVFLGGRLDRSIWFSLYVGVQAVVLTALFTAMLMGVREVFILGYRRRYPEVMDALTGYFDILVGWFAKAMVQEYLILLGGGGLALGLLLHVLNRGMERRRNVR
ncbi:TrgA family protein [Pararhodobacter aggregans]|uniref:TrgA family protein n=1 Tax=Pararhodobacter aggregans TaxID=404875 RepID=UPI003A8FCD87